MSEEFSIVSKGAQLVEVSGDGPYTDLPGGLMAPDGVEVSGPVDLLNDFIRCFRVDAAESVQTTVRVTDSPFGALLGLRRCVVVPARELLPKHPVVVDWHDQLRAHISQLWRMPMYQAIGALIDAGPILIGAAAQAVIEQRTREGRCTWQDVATKESESVLAQGGDLVVVSFVVP